MMKRTAVVLLGCCLPILAGCSDATPTYEFIVGQTSVTLPIHDDPRLIQADLLDAVRPLWDELEYGESAVFQFRRVTAFEPNPADVARVKEKHGSGAILTATQTTSGSRFRFFKGRDGEDGYEVVEETGVAVYCRGNVEEWETMAAILGGEAGPFGLDLVRRLIQRIPDDDRVSRLRSH